MTKREDIKRQTNKPTVEPWSSGYRRRLMFQRSLVRILDGHLFVVRIVMFA